MKSQLDKDVIVCRCEGVTLRDLMEAAGAEPSARSVKMVTRAAMGTCQSRMCHSSVEKVLENHGADDKALRSRPPVRPVLLEDMLRDVVVRTGEPRTGAAEASQAGPVSALVELPQNELSIQQHPILGAAPGMGGVRFTFDGEEYVGLSGEPIATALLKAGVRTLGHTADGRPRGIFCGVGHCYECRVEIEGIGEVRSCITPLEPGMKIRSIGEARSSTGVASNHDA